MSKVLVIFGTRPEAIKLCPVILQMQKVPGVQVRVCATAQHREMLDQVLDVFGVHPNYDLNVMTDGQTLFGSTSRIMAGLESVIHGDQPDFVIVQGDTTTTLCGALAGFYSHTPVGHVEAGLRTGDIHEPFPEEMNRVVTTRLATLHFTPTTSSAENLYREGIASESVFVTGNTGIDAVLYVRNALDDGRLQYTWDTIDFNKKLIVVTAHRRENFGAGLEQICSALSLLARRDDVQIVYPVHPNPRVKEYVTQRLRGHANIILVEPVAYVPFVDLMRRAYLLITDSGGIQEEGPSLGKPILVLRRKTERPEAVQAGTVRLVGTDENAIVAEAIRLLDDRDAYDYMARLHNPYGDGHAAERIGRAIADFLNARA